MPGLKLLRKMSYPGGVNMTKLLLFTQPHPAGDPKLTTLFLWSFFFGFVFNHPGSSQNIFSEYDFE